MPRVTSKAFCVAGLVLCLLWIAIGQAQESRLPKVGDEVLVKWGGKDWDALIVSSDGTKIRIRYHKWGNGKEHENVNPDRVTFKGVKLTSAQLEGGVITPPPANNVPAPRTQPQPAATAATPPAALRTWTDSSGQFKIDAAFIALVDGKIELKKGDGTTIKMPLDRLSAADQQEAQRLSSANARASAAANPFEAATSAPVEPANPAPTAIVRNDPNTDRTAKKPENAQSIQLQGPILSGLSPDPSVKFEPTLSKKGTILRVPPKNSFWQRPKGIMSHHDWNYGLVFILNDTLNKTHGTHVERISLATSDIGRIYELDISFTPEAVSPRGNLVVGSALDEKNHGYILQFLEMKSDGTLRLAQSSPLGKQINDIGWRAENQLFAYLGDSALTSFSYPALEPQYTIPMTAKGKFTLSGGGKYIAVSATPGVFILEAATGNVLGQVEGTAGDLWALSFDPSGKYLALATNSRVMIWDVANGRKFKDFSLPKAATADRVHWEEGGLISVLAGKELWLVDVPRSVLLWTYRGIDFDQHFAGHHWTLLRESGNNPQWGLGHFKIPHAAATAAQAKINREENDVLKPGSTVSLAFNLPFAEQDLQAIRDSYTRQFQDAGITVAENAPLKLECSTSPGESKEMTFEGFGRARGQVFKVTVTPTKYLVALKENENTLWTATGTTGSAGAILLSPGQTVEQFFAELTRPKPKFFLGTKLPRQLARHPSTGSFGFSQLSVAGLVDQPQ